MEKIVNGRADPEYILRTCTWEPRFDVMQWYKANRFDLLLHLDPAGAIRSLHNSISDSWSYVNSDSVNQPARLPTLVLAALEVRKENLDMNKLQKYIDAAHIEEAKKKEKLGDLFD